ncbi:hypothetical protein ELQ87_36295 [Streptomyces griseoviridis]|uniref:Uncharacterized protein n=1 Tax=Streptomyces griseoviridis TaxID=45398 RepID=A0A3Q9KZA4_STRGD|nr:MULTISPECIES: hypothetical protein [Streptomyces]AZS89097.1 hypothetical protein ELQ87_36295 [Streptomyces griseoviridis]MDH6697781.1 hypothetical protein [Streptomyces sp. MAA16]QCN84054.1 hypothetical protein DDJ31_02945 [Streptomyces griseoviridis]
MDHERTHPEPVSVFLSDCSRQDAGTVFGTLCACFASDRTAEDAPAQQDTTRPMVWLGTFDVADAHTGSAPAHLDGTVSADVQGGYWAVERFRRALESVYSVQDLTGASGDQERDVHLRLESR